MILLFLASRRLKCEIGVDGNGLLIGNFQNDSMAAQGVNYCLFLYDSEHR